MLFYKVSFFLLIVEFKFTLHTLFLILVLWRRPAPFSILTFMTNLLMNDWSSNITHFLLLDNFCRICSVCISILGVVSWVDFKFQNIFRNLSGISKTLAKLISIFVWPSNYVLTGVLLQKRRYCIYNKVWSEFEFNRKKETL